MEKRLEQEWEEGREGLGEKEGSTEGDRSPRRGARDLRISEL